MFSIKSGFINNINPKIIGNIENLNLIPRLENIKKRDNNSLTYNELNIKINNSKYGK